MVMMYVLCSSYLACVSAWFAASANKGWVQTERFVQSGVLQSRLALLELHDWQWHSLHYHAVFAGLAEHIFAPSAGKAVWIIRHMIWWW